MKLFIWKRIDGVTKSYHSEAGLCAIAPDEAFAEELIAQKTLAPLESIPKPDGVYQLADPLVEMKVWVFPDAGCC